MKILLHSEASHWSRSAAESFRIPETTDEESEKEKLCGIREDTIYFGQ